MPEILRRRKSGSCYLDYESTQSKFNNTSHCLSRLDERGGGNSYLTFFK